MFTVPWMDSRYFDAQLEDYLLHDAQRHDRAGGLPSLGKVQYHETKDSEWLTLTGVVAGALIDSQELVYLMVSQKEPQSSKLKREMGKLA